MTIKTADSKKIRRSTVFFRIIKQLRSNGPSFRGIARELNKRLLLIKKNGIWQAATVSTILSRVGNQKMV